MPVVQSDIEDELEDVDDLEFGVHDEGVLLLHRYRQSFARLAVGRCSAATAAASAIVWAIRIQPRNATLNPIFEA